MFYSTIVTACANSPTLENFSLQGCFQRLPQAGHLTRKMRTSGDYSPLVLLVGEHPKPFECTFGTATRFFGIAEMTGLLPIRFFLLRIIMRFSVLSHDGVDIGLDQKQFFHLVPSLTVFAVGFFLLSQKLRVLR